jgi:hypothetical protein
MDVKKFGWMLVMLGAILASVASYYAFIPYIDRWEHFRVVAEATNVGYVTQEYIEMKAGLIQGRQRIFQFGWASAVSIFLGVAFIFSANKSKTIGQRQVQDVAMKTYWVCGKCNETTETAKNTCWSCGAPKV